MFDDVSRAVVNEVVDYIPSYMMHVYRICWNLIRYGIRSICRSLLDLVTGWIQKCPWKVGSSSGSRKYFS